MTILLRFFWTIIILTFFIGATATYSQRTEIKRTVAASSSPPYCIGKHDIGLLQFGITNFGRVGIGEIKGVMTDCFTGHRVGQGEYPKGESNICFYKGGLWVGAVVGKDTLVSVGAELNNQSREFHPVIPMIRRSTLDPRSSEYIGAFSEKEYIAIYADTFSRNSSWDPIDHRPHKSLGIEVQQRSFSWSYSHTDDFVLIEYNIKNIGNNYLKDTYVGLYWDSDIYNGGVDVVNPPDPYGRKTSRNAGQDDLGGFISEIPYSYKNCEYIDTLAMMWALDADGNPFEQEFMLPDVTALCFLGSFPKSWGVSFNWWNYNYSSSYDIGPQTKQDFRQMGNGTGTPYGDRNKYAILSSGEIDYDPIYTYAIQPVDQKWVQPPSDVARFVTRGFDFQGVLSIGPFDLLPGASVTIPVAYVGGQNVHQDRWDYDVGLGYFYWPDHYRDNLDFSDLFRNVLASGRAYDTPGLDSDGDGYAGKFEVCNDDTFYYEGDGTPDLSPEAPPPPPKIWVYPIRNGLRIRFNGFLSETTPDIFSSKIDFEGYHVFIARDNCKESFSLLASYDQLDYNKYVLVTNDNPHDEDEFMILDDPFSLEELRCMYSSAIDPCNDSTFDPLNYTMSTPYFHFQFPDSIFYFTPHDFNQSEFGATTDIRKIYPNEPPPKSNKHFLPDELTEDGYPKYYEYEYIVNNLLPTVPYWVSVTAFDFGSFRTGLNTLESGITLFAKEAYPNTSWDEKPNEVGRVYVYPNPYRQDSWYRVNGLEGLGEWDRSRDRVRKVTFANLPSRCWIRIFSLDGDLIRELWHNVDSDDPNSSYKEWDLVTRNSQMIVSGLYYWVVEDEQGHTQIGKLVILM